MALLLARMAALTVFTPLPGAPAAPVQARVALASTAELDAAVADAAKAQVGWGATNPQKRARVMMELVLAVFRIAEHVERLPRVVDVTEKKLDNE
jgi:acyl-CoA reductase-like NAD-dependent aldehyde dehydrogenase